MLIYFPDNVPSRRMATRGDPCLVFLVDDGLNAIEKSEKKGRQQGTGDYSRSGTERARSGFCSDSGERIRDHGDEQVDKPKIEHDDTNDEKEGGYEELRVDHRIHQL